MANDATDAGLDDASEGADDALDQGLAVVDEATDIAVPAKTDATSETEVYDNNWRYWDYSEWYIGGTACLGVVWWFMFGWFIYIRTN